MDAKDSIVLLHSREAGKNSAFGTAFLVARADGYSYLLTCAHVVEQINRKDSTDNHLKILGLDETVEVVKCGSRDGIDMALLRVRGLEGKPLLERFARGQKDQAIGIVGFRRFDSTKWERRPLNCKLGKSTDLFATEHDWPQWDITIQDDIFSKLDEGYSGSPLYNTDNQVVGVVSHRRSGELGHAFCISNLPKLYPEITKLLPSLENLDELSRIARINTALLKRMSDIAASYMAIAKRLKQIDQNQSLDAEDQIVLGMCEAFIERAIEASDLKSFFENLAAPPSHTQRRPNYKLLAQRLNQGEIALCLGSDLPALFDSAFQPSTKLVEQIAAIAHYDFVGRPALSEVCEYAELNTDQCTRGLVVNELKNLLSTPLPRASENPLYDLLAHLEKPFVVIDSAFNDALCRHLQKSRRKFVSIVPLPGEEPAHAQAPEKLILDYSDRESVTCADDELSGLRLLEQGYVLIYHTRGLLERHDTLLLAERDFFNSNHLLDRKYPAYLRNKLRNRGTGLCFLGHAPDSWEARLVAKVLMHQRRDHSEAALVIQPHADRWAQLFWRHLKCDLYEDLDVSEFIANLKAAL